MKRKRIYRYYTFGCFTDSYAEAQRLSQENGTKVQCYKLVFSNGKMLEKMSTPKRRKQILKDLTLNGYDKFKDADLYNERVCEEIDIYLLTHK